MLTLTSPRAVAGATGPAARGAVPPAALMWRVAAALALMACLTALASLVDARQLGYHGVWAKPFKFQLALALQTATLAWGVQQLQPALQRIALPAWLARGWAVVVAYEAAYITLQGARGVASHFNRSTPWESAAGTLMATFAGVLVSVTMWIGAVALWQAWRERRAGVRAATHTGLMRLAIGLGFVLGGLLAGWSGSAMGAARGYWLAPLAEPVLRLPVTGWVLSQTDLRIAHFVGLHQMQLLPALAVLGAVLRWRRATTTAVLATVSLAAVLAVHVLLQS